ncbi:MAG: cohesin domain-containing protein [Chloroflexota bacterium]|nr:cohesin domain-containing protein [Chloroflexota bacterium]
MRKARYAGIGALVLVLILALSTAAGIAKSEGTATLRVIAPTNAIQVGESFPVQITGEGLTNLGAFEFQFLFDPSVVNTSVWNIQLSDFLGSTGRQTGVLRLSSAAGGNPGPMFGAYSYGSPLGPTGAGNLASIVVTAEAPGVSQLDLGAVQITDVDGNILSYEIVPSAVLVANPVETRPLYLPLLLASR